MSPARFQDSLPWHSRPQYQSLFQTGKSAERRGSIQQSLTSHLRRTGCWCSWPVCFEHRCQSSACWKRRRILEYLDRKCRKSMCSRRVSNPQCTGSLTMGMFRLGERWFAGGRKRWRRDLRLRRWWKTAFLLLCGVDEIELLGFWERLSGFVFWLKWCWIYDEMLHGEKEDTYTSDARIFVMRDVREISMSTS